MIPSRLPDPGGMLAIDTETSGLFPDDGARTSVVQVGWIPAEIVGSQEALEYAIATGDGVRSYAFPFDQGIEGKPEDIGVRGLFDEETPNLDVDEWYTLLAWIKRNAERYGVTGHNLPFDLEKVRVGTRFWDGVDIEPSTGYMWDTQVAQKELDPAHPVGLKPTAERQFGLPQDESKAIQDWLKSFCKQRGYRFDDYRGRYDLVPWEIMQPYAERDTSDTIRLYWQQMLRFHVGGEGNMRQARERMALMRVLHRMQHRGIPYPAGESFDVAGELRARQAGLLDRLPFEPTDAKAKAWFFGEQGVEPYAWTDAAKPTPQLTAEHVQRIADEYTAPAKAHVKAAAEAWLDWSKLETACSMWYEGYGNATGDDGRLRTYFRQSYVRSGRLSVERVNLQAIPQDYRLGDFEILAGVPTPRTLIGHGFDQYRDRGWVAYEMDLAQAELRVAAQKADCKSMLESIYAGTDLHGEGVRSLFHIDKNDERWFPFRQAMKRGNFSLIFGVGAKKLQADIRKNTGLVMSDNDAQRFVRDWNGLYPEYARAIDRHEREAKRKGFTGLVNGAQRWYAMNEDYHKAFNQYVQGSLAEFGAMWSVYTEALLERLGVYQQAALDKVTTGDGFPAAGLLLTIHDSQVLLLPVETAGEIIEEISAWVAKTATDMFDVPMAADAAEWGKK